MRYTFLFLLFLFLVAGCGPKFTPLLAEHAVHHDAVLDRTASAKVGESMFRGLDSYAYAVYSPRDADTLLPAPYGSVVLQKDQQWIAWYSLEDGSLIVQVPELLAPEGVRMGLRLDEQGQVLGNRPWFDLREKSRFNQSAWKGRRLLFERKGRYPVDVFYFDLCYAGMREGRGVFNYKDFKAKGVKDAEFETLVLGAEDSLRIHGLEVRILAVYPDHVRYEVEPVR